MYLKYYFGKEDEEELLEIYCDREMILEAIYEEFDTPRQFELVEIMLDELETDVLFDCFYDVLIDYYEDYAKQIWNGEYDD